MNNHSKKVPSQIFVLGAPRSGTTIMGRYLSSSEKAFSLGEYMSFYVIPHSLGKAFKDSRSDHYRAGLIDHLMKSAHDYGSMLVRNNNCHYYVDDTPLNLIKIPEIEVNISNSIYICMVRSLGGVVRSLEKSYNDGIAWAGEDTKTRIDVWLDFYSRVETLPKERTLFITYEELITDPNNTIDSIHLFLKRHSIDISGIKLETFTESDFGGVSKSFFSIDNDTLIPESKIISKIEDDLKYSELLLEKYNVSLYEDIYNQFYKGFAK